MLGIGWGEMLVIAVVVLIVVGPKDLPMMMRNVGKAMGTMRKMSSEFRREIDKALAADEIREARKAISDPLSQTSAEISREFNAIRDGRVEPSGKLKPAEPGKESVVDEIRAQAGMAPRTTPQEAVAATAAARTAGESKTPGNAVTTTAGEGVVAEKPKTKSAPKNAVTSSAGTAKSEAVKTPKPRAKAAKPAAKLKTSKPETAPETPAPAAKKPARKKKTAQPAPASEPVGGED